MPLRHRWRTVVDPRRQSYPWKVFPVWCIVFCTSYCKVSGCYSDNDTESGLPKILQAKQTFTYRIVTFSRIPIIDSNRNKKKNKQNVKHGAEAWHTYRQTKDFVGCFQRLIPENAFEIPRLDLLVAERIKCPPPRTWRKENNEIYRYALENMKL